MAISLQCPASTSLLTLRNEPAGKKTRCPKFSDDVFAITVPAQQSAIAAVA
jgi:hypothetical protein